MRPLRGNALTTVSRSYVPVKVDYSDLYDIMTFFRGGPDGKYGHDAMAAKIGSEGKRWAKDHVRAHIRRCSIPVTDHGLPLFIFDLTVEEARQ